MKNKRALPRIGIIGGAGPIAGLQLANHIIRICQNKYQCVDDADFPYIMLLSFPFADMLTIDSGNSQRELLQKQLKECFETFSQHKISYAAIACNTLHEFLVPSPGIEFLHMIKETAEFLKKNEISRSINLCTETSSKTQLHRKFFNCEYPSVKDQAIVDEVIYRILGGNIRAEDSEKLAKIAAKFRKDENTPLGIILGCTELPLLNDKFPIDHFVKNCVIIDPMMIVAERLCKLVMNK